MTAQQKNLAAKDDKAQAESADSTDSEKSEAGYSAFRFQISAFQPRFPSRRN
jgi:hypothetical protein